MSSIAIRVGITSNVIVVKLTLSEGEGACTLTLEDERVTGLFLHVAQEQFGITGGQADREPQREPTKI